GRGQGAAVLVGQGGEHVAAAGHGGEVVAAVRRVLVGLAHVEVDDDQVGGAGGDGDVVVGVAAPPAGDGRGVGGGSAFPVGEPGGGSLGAGGRGEHVPAAGDGIERGV